MEERINGKSLIGGHAFLRTGESSAIKQNKADSNKRQKKGKFQSKIYIYIYILFPFYMDKGLKHTI